MISKTKEILKIRLVLNCSAKKVKDLESFLLNPFHHKKDGKGKGGKTCKTQV